MPVPLPPNAKQVFKGAFHEIWEWNQELYDGTREVFSCVVRNDSAAVIPFLDADTILLQQEEHPGRGVPFMDPPGGIVDSGETPEAAVMRELTEETGYRADRIQLFRTHVARGRTRFAEHTFLATGLTDVNGKHPDAGERITVKPTPWKEAVSLCLKGKLRRQEVMLAILAMEFDPEARALKERFLNG